MSETQQEEIPDKHEENKPARDEKGRLLPGNTANPNGRPKGQSLKEFWRERFKNMTDEERVAFTKKVGNETIWKMAEGNPPLEIKGDIEVKSKVVKLDE